MTSEIEEEGLDNYRIIVTPTIANTYWVHSFINIGYSGFAFIDIAYTRAYYLPFFTLTKLRPLRGFNDNIKTYITHYTRTSININRYINKLIFFFLTRLKHYALILSLP